MAGWEQARDEVIAWYKQFLGREPNQSEWQYWVHQIVVVGNDTPDAATHVMDAIRRSDEAMNAALQGTGDDREFIAGLYQNVLERPADAAGLAYWTTILGSGRMTREQIAAAFERFEPAAYVDELYQGLLGREANADELAYWSDVIARGQLNRQQVELFIRQSPEFLTRVPGQAPPGEDMPDGLAQLQATLESYGLGSLTDWAKQQLIGGKSIDEVLLALRETPEFQAAFPEIKLRQEAGMTPVSVSDIINYREQAQQLLRAAGLPSTFYDQPDDFQQFIVKNVSLVELRDRITDGYRQVEQAPQEVRDEFARLYGPNGDAALAAWFLDPDRATTVLETQRGAAFGAGAAKAYGFNLTLERAEQLARTGLTAENAYQGFSNIDALKPVFAETISEGTDLTGEQQGVDAVFNLGGDGATQIRQRLNERKAAVSGGGGSVLTQQGLGLGGAGE